MTTPRRRQICLDVTPYYHCITRCVRRCFLCGYDKQSKKNYNHRRSWIEERLLQLSEVFCIDIAGYSVMSNHYHVVLRVDKEQADLLSDDQVIDRWRRLYRGPDIVTRYKNGESLSRSERNQLKSVVSQWRDNLSNLSRLIGNLNEYIARKANKEDECKGAFWESRFKSQAVLDLPALLATLCYVDLNPVRAKMAKTPESSQYTSVQRRLSKRKSGLIPFQAKRPENHERNSGIFTCNWIPISFRDYLELLEWTGKQLKIGKRGAIGPDSPSIMSRLGYTAEQWVKTQNPQMGTKQKALGSIARIADYCKAIGQNWIWQYG